ncbi:MAG: sulfurtransferase, partial [Dehalococcoidia bacterium]|nr:sulfurtransferase [Dehalococcoidia bacterium]
DRFFRWLGISLVVLLTVSSCAPSTETVSYPNGRLLVETEWLSQHLGDPPVRIVDVRGSNSYEDGHIPGSVYLNMGDMVDPKASVRGMLAPQDQIEAKLGSLGISPETTVVVYDDSGGLWASRLFWVLDYLQHKDVRLLNGSFSKWVRESRPTSKDIPRVEATQYKGNPLPERSATKEWVLGKLKDSNMLLVDARTPGEYQGQDLAGNKRGGHIPGAVNVEWGRNLSPTGTWKSAKDLEKMYVEAGVAKDKEIVTYCQTGVRAAHDYFTLRLLGYPNIHLYDGSWEEWGNDPTLPIAN